MWIDSVNSMFEGFGVYACVGNIRALRRDRDVKGIVWQYTAVWWVWGLWNMVYYPFLHQWWSAAAGGGLCIGNFIWVYMWIKIRRSKQ